jgi:hypothetical protein
MSNFDDGFNPKKYASQTTKIGKNYQKKTKSVSQSGIQSKDQRSSNDYNTRVHKGNNKPMSMTYGSTDKAGRGTTVYKKVKKK